MVEDQMTALTDGYLPFAAFRHLEPTGIGVIDLEQSITPRAPDGRPWGARERDGLVLVRLHGEPLSVIHIDHCLLDVTAEELAGEVWRSAGGQIRRHVEMLKCIRTEGSCCRLVEAVQSSASACPGSGPAKLGMSVAVIVPTTGREAQLERCLRSLLAQRGGNFEVIVVDNRPATGAALRTVSAMAANDSRVRYVAEARGGSSVARNRGVSETDAELVAFADDDVLVDTGWLECLLAPFAEADVTATCGMVLPLELQTPAQKRFEHYGGFSKGVTRRSFDLQTGRREGLLLYPFLGDVFGSGNNMAFRRLELVAAGGFDAALGGGSPARAGEDIYAFSESILRGGRLVYEPRALAWHEHRRDGEALRGQIFDYGVGLGAIVTKVLLSGDLRFFPAIARSLPVVLRSRPRAARRGQAGADGDGEPAVSKALVRARRAGMLRGPLRYATGLMRARRLGFGDVIRKGSTSPETVVSSRT